MNALIKIQSLFKGDNQTDAEIKVKERTFIMLKPDGVQRGLLGQVLVRLE